MSVDHTQCPWITPSVRGSSGQDCQGVMAPAPHSQRSCMTQPHLNQNGNFPPCTFKTGQFLFEVSQKCSRSLKCSSVYKDVPQHSCITPQALTGTQAETARMCPNPEQNQQGHHCSDRGMNTPRTRAAPVLSGRQLRGTGEKESGKMWQRKDSSMLSSSSQQ